MNCRKIIDKKLKDREANQTSEPNVVLRLEGNRPPSGLATANDETKAQGTQTEDFKTQSVKVTLPKIKQHKTKKTNTKCARVQIKMKAYELRLMLITANLSETEFAQLAQISPDHFSRIMNGHTIPFGQTRVKILQTLSQVSQRNLVFGDLFEITGYRSK